MRIWWCQEHNSERYPVERKGRCWHVIVAGNFKIDAPCRMVPMRLVPDNAETRWLCRYPEFGDDACMVDHDPVSTRQPRKHTTCGWFLTVPTFVDAAFDGERP